MKKYTGVRVETITNEEDFQRRQQHNYRKNKIQSVVNNEGFFYLENNSFKNQKGFNSYISNKKINETEETFFNRKKELRKLNPKVHSKRNKPLRERILYFSEGINEDFQNNKKLFFKKIFEFKNGFEKKYKTEIIDLVVHPDEKGNVHIHFTFKNYDLTNGQSLNFTRNKKNGSELQTLRGDYFHDFGQGYFRGETKEKPRKHLSIEEYKEYQETQKQLQEMKLENDNLKKQNQELKNENELLKQTNEKLLESINTNILNHYNDMKEFYEDLILMLDIEDETTFFKNLQRYMKGRRKEQLKKHINKMEGKLQKIKKKQNSMEVKQPKPRDYSPGMN